MEMQHIPKIQYVSNSTKCKSQLKSRKWQDQATINLGVEESEGHLLKGDLVVGDNWAVAIEQVNHYFGRFLDFTKETSCMQHG